MRRPGLEPGSPAALGLETNYDNPYTNDAFLDNRTRTSDLRNYSPPLYQLSYIELKI